MQKFRKNIEAQIIKKVAWTYAWAGMNTGMPMQVDMIACELTRATILGTLYSKFQLEQVDTGQWKVTMINIETRKHRKRSMEAMALWGA